MAELRPPAADPPPGPSAAQAPRASRWPLVAMAAILCATAISLAWLYLSARRELDGVRAEQSAKQAAAMEAEKRAHGDRHDRMEASSRAGWLQIRAQGDAIQWIMDAQQRVYEQAGGKGEVLPRPPPDTITQATGDQRMAPAQ